MSYFNILSQTMTSMFVRGIAEIAELFVAIKRLEQFLLNEEFSAASNSNGNNNEDFASSKIALNMHGFTAKWNSASSDNTLSNINLSVPKGNLIGIIGPVGSGKSSLLQAVLSKLPSTCLSPCNA